MHTVIHTDFDQYIKDEFLSAASIVFGHLKTELETLGKTGASTKERGSRPPLRRFVLPFAPIRDDEAPSWLWVHFAEERRGYRALYYVVVGLDCVIGEASQDGSPPEPPEAAFQTAVDLFNDIY